VLLVFKEVLINVLVVKVVNFCLKMDILQKENVLLLVLMDIGVMEQIVMLVLLDAPPVLMELIVNLVLGING